MTYNSAGQRSRYTVAKGGTTSLDEQFTYRGGELAQAVVVSGTQTYTDTYLYDPNGLPLELLRQQNGSTSRYWYEEDGQGSVVALTDPNGNVVDRYAYDAWGAPTSVSEGVSQPFRYAGYWWDAALGWYWVSVRPYDPALKRWLQPDPSQADGVRTYIYVGDDPVDGTDPTGLDYPTCGYAIATTYIGCPSSPEATAGQAVYNAVIGDDVETIRSNPDTKLKALAAADLVLFFVPVEKIAKGVVITARVVRDVIKSAAAARHLARLRVTLQVAERAAQLLRDARVVRLARQLKFDPAAAPHQSEYSRRVPLYLLAEAILYGKRLPDPLGAAGAAKYVLDNFSRDFVSKTNQPKSITGTLTVIYREADKAILHYDYYSK